MAEKGYYVINWWKAKHQHALWLQWCVHLHQHCKVDITQLTVTPFPKKRESMYVCAFFIEKSRWSSYKVHKSPVVRLLAPWPLLLQLLSHLTLYVSPDSSVTEWTDGSGTPESRRTEDQWSSAQLPDLSPKAEVPEPPPSSVNPSLE